MTRKLGLMRGIAASCAGLIVLCHGLAAVASCPCPVYSADEIIKASTWIARAKITSLEINVSQCQGRYGRFTCEQDLTITISSYLKGNGPVSINDRMVDDPYWCGIPFRLDQEFLLLRIKDDEGPWICMQYAVLYDEEIRTQVIDALSK